MSNETKLTSAQARSLARLVEAGGIVEHDWVRGFRQDGSPVKGLHSTALKSLVDLGLVVCTGRQEEISRKQRREEIRGGYIIRRGWETVTLTVWVAQYSAVK